MKPKVILLSFGFIAGLLGCHSPVLSVTPYPCKNIAEIDGLDEELTSLRDADNMLKQLGMQPLSEKTRNYVVESDVKCSHDKELTR